MSNSHYVLRRSRNGRFNFTLIAREGRILGSVTVSTSCKTKEEILQEAHQKICAVARELLIAIGYEGRASELDRPTQG